MTFLVELAMSPASVFQYPIDGVVVDVPEEFRPRIGETVDLGRVLGVDGKLCVLQAMVVVGLRWILVPGDPPHRPAHHVFPASSQGGRLRMRLTLSSEAPSDRKTRKVHG